MWLPIEVKSGQSNSIIDVCNKLSSFQLSSYNQATKWKTFDQNNQVVIRDKDVYYKIYCTDMVGGYFANIVRDQLAKIYREKYNIQWDVQTIKVDNLFYQIQKRQPLLVATHTMISYDELFDNWGIIHRELEDALSLDKIAQQLREVDSRIAHVKLVRDCFNKFEDYAIHNNSVVLLDDADWFLACVDKDGNWLKLPWFYQNVIFNNSEMLFAPIDFYNKQTHSLNTHLGSVGHDIDMWMLFPSVRKHDYKQVKQQVLDMRKKMLADNIKHLCNFTDSQLVFEDDDTKTLMIS